MIVYLNNFWFKIKKCMYHPAKARVKEKGTPPLPGGFRRLYGKAPFKAGDVGERKSFLPTG
jgi:hypothetical protein